MMRLKLEPEEAVMAIAEAEYTLGLTLGPIHYQVVYYTLIGKQVQWMGAKKGGKDTAHRIMLHIASMYQ